MDEPKRRFATHFPVGSVPRDYVDPESGLRYLIVRGPYSWCGYVGVKADHALAGLEEFEFPCHFGVTFSGWGSADGPRPEGWYWWGWDYAHFTDRIDFLGSLPDDVPAEIRAEMEKLDRMFQRDAIWKHTTPKNWSLDEVAEDAMDVLMELKDALLLSEEFAKLVVLR